MARVTKAMQEQIRAKAELISAGKKCLAEAVKLENKKLRIPANARSVANVYVAAHKEVISGLKDAAKRIAKAAKEM